MGPELHLKSTPDLRFIHDERVIYEDKINRMLKNIHLKKKIDDS